jgi:hypothetical protein
MLFCRTCTTYSTTSVFVLRVETREISVWKEVCIRAHGRGTLVAGRMREQARRFSQAFPAYAGFQPNAEEVSFFVKPDDITNPSSDYVVSADKTEQA